MKTYMPPADVLEKYANLIVEFGLQNREGKQPEPGAVVHFVVPEAAKPLYYHLQASILRHGYQPLGQYLPSSDETYNFEKSFYENASPSQRTYHLEKVKKAYVDQADCVIYVLADTLPQGLKDTSPEHMLEHRRAQKASITHKWKKVNSGKLNWTIVLYGTVAGAKEAGLSLEAYWQQIIKACYLDSKNPTKEWYRIDKTVKSVANKLTALQIETMHMVGDDVDLRVRLGADRKWLAGGGNNIPSFEVFTSPDYRHVDGWIRFNQPLYIFGKKIEGIELWFEQGVVVKSAAKKNHDLLAQVLATKGGNQLGEVSLTDARLSRIEHFMAETLYDENVGGQYGNTHVAIGSSFHDCYVGDGSAFKASDWAKRGFNSSVVHHDIVSTTNRTVTATLQDGSKKVIYKNGKFTI